MQRGKSTLNLSLDEKIKNLNNEIIKTESELENLKNQLEKAMKEKEEQSLAKFYSSFETEE